MLTTLPTGFGALAASENSTPFSIFQKGPPLGLGVTILASFYDHSPLCPWLIWSHDNHRVAG